MQHSDYKINIDLTRQVLQLHGTDGVIREYTVSTGKNGIGEQLDSGCTPRGRHSIAQMIGAGCAPDTVFAGRQATASYIIRNCAGNTPDMTGYSPGLSGCREKNPESTGTVRWIPIAATFTYTAHPTT